MLEEKAEYQPRLPEERSFERNSREQDYAGQGKDDGQGEGVVALAVAGVKSLWQHQ